MRKSFYSLSDIVTNHMKILHAEYGGLVIYNMKLERGAFKLPEIDSEDPASSRGIDWSDLMMIVQGVSPSEVKRCSC